MSTGAFKVISSLTLDSTQLQNTGSGQSPDLAFANNPRVDSNFIIESGFRLEFHDPTDTFSTNIKAGAQAFNITLTLPVTQPAAGQALSSLDGTSGNLTWLSFTSSPGTTVLGEIPFYNDTSGASFDVNSSFKWDNVDNNLIAAATGTITNAGSGVILGGVANTIDSVTSVFTIGGTSNLVQNCANSGTLGGTSNNVTGDRSLALAGESNTVNGTHSYASGFKSLAGHNYCFVFSDHLNIATGLQTTADGQALFQATGGFGFVSGEMTLTSFPNNFINIYSDTVANRAKLQYKNNGGTISTTILDVLQVKGDLYTFNSTTNDRLGVGTNGQILSANSATTTGLEWINNTTGTVTSIAAGSNIVCTPDPIVSTGTVALSATPSGLTSLGVGNLSISGTTISTAQTTLLLTATGTNSVISLKPNGSSGYIEIRDSIDIRAVPIRFYDANFPSNNYVALHAPSVVSASITLTLPGAIAAGVMVSNGSGVLSLTATPSGLTSLGVGNFTISGSTITTAVSSLNLSSVDGRALFNAGGGNPGLGLFFNTGGFYASIGANTSATGNMAFTLPATHTTNGLLVNTGSGVLAETITPSGLTSVGVGNLTLAGDTITGTNGVLIQSTGSGQAVGLSPKGAAQIRIFSQDASNAVPLRFYNSAGTQYVEFKAGTLAGSTTWTWPTADAAGTWVSDGAGATSFTASPSIYRSIVSVSGTSKTFALSDANTFQQCTNGSTVTLTVDTNANVAFAVGTEIDIYQEGAGQVVISAAGGVTIESQFSNLKIASQYTGATLKKLATNTWALIGNLTA